MTSRKHVESGYCLQDTDTDTHTGTGTVTGTYGLELGESFCALEPGQCNAHQNWRSSRQTFSSASAGDYNFQTCVSESESGSSTSVGAVYLGQCGGDGCAADEESCGDAVFVPANAGWNADLGISNNKDGCRVENAKFGNCNGRCVWSKDACEEGERYHLPGTGSGQGSGSGTGGGGGGGGGTGKGNEGGGNKCTCDKVQVGGCKTQPEHANANANAPILYCAVSQDACDEFQTYMSHDQILSQENVACYLCRGDTDTVTVPANPDANAGEGSQAPMSTGKMIGMICALFGWSVVLFAFLWYHKKKAMARRTFTDSSDEVIVKPMPTFMPSHINVDTDHGIEIQEVVSEIEDPSIMFVEDPKGGTGTGTGTGTGIHIDNKIT